MKSIFDEGVRKELITRINSLNENSKSKWGKMNVFQMAKHCTIWDAWIQGKNNQKYKQMFLGLIFGKIALKSTVKNDKAFSKNIPAGKDLVVKETQGDIEQQKKKWIECIVDYEYFSNPAFIHDFFGKMTTEEIGIFVYKHADHHLRQFGS